METNVSPLSRREGRVRMNVIGNEGQVARRRREAAVNDKISCTTAT
jgi:hypothetical protein